MRPVHGCTDCDGAGGLRVEEPGEPTGWWKCEGCDGSGAMTSCEDCGDPMSVPEAEAHSGHCVHCRAYWDERDYQAEVESLRRMG